MKQDEIFFNSEGDRWFRRNESELGLIEPENDAVLRILQFYNISTHRVLEVGGSSGFRLHQKDGCKV
jgi:hypothetical protein